MLKLKRIHKVIVDKMANLRKPMALGFERLRQKHFNNININKIKNLVNPKLLKDRKVRLGASISVIVLIALTVQFKTVDVNDNNSMLTTSLVSNTNSYEVYYNNTLLGIIEDEQYVDSATQYALMELNIKYNEVYALPEQLKVVSSHHEQEEIVDLEQLKQNLLIELEENIGDLLVQAYVIEVDNGTSVTLNDLEEVKEALTIVSNKYVPEDEQYQVTNVEVNSTDEDNITLSKVDNTVVSVMSSTEPKTARTSTFATSEEMVPELEPVDDNEASDEQEEEDDNVEVTSVKLADKVVVTTKFVKAEELKSVNQAVETLTDYEEEQVIYVVKAGDTLSEIVEDHGMTMEQIEKLNPGIIERERYLQIGEEINITKPDPNLSIEITEVVTYQEPIEQEIVYEYDDTQYSTYSRVKSKGSDGIKQVTAEVSKIDGVEEEKTILKELVLAEPVPKVIVKGTLTPPQFIPPLNGGTITSYFGPRWGKNHNGIDIAASRGTNVYASASGYVEFSGWYGGYGNLVIINHGNGYKTYYGHNSTNYVSTGEYVNQGDIIAAVGSTGDSTGNHVHFEMRQYGTPVNPYSYIY